MSVDTSDVNLSETLVGTRGVYHKVLTPESVDTSDCSSRCALHSLKYKDAELCPKRSGRAYDGGSLDCVRSGPTGVRGMRFVWRLVTDFTNVDEGGVV